MTPREFYAWLHDPARREPFEYHRGYLAEDIGREHREFAFDRSRPRPAFQVKQVVDAALERHIVRVVQRKHGAGDYSYLAVKG